MEKKRLFNHVKPSGQSLSLLVTLLVTAMTLLPQSVWAQTGYGLSVGGVAVTSENAEAITGDNISGTISFDPSTNKLTLDNASVNGFAYSNGCIVSRLSDLTIVIKGNNTLECSKDSCTAIRSEAVATLTIEKGEDECSLSFSGSRAIRDFKTLTLTGIHWDWGNNYTYDVGNFGYGEGYGLLDASGGEAQNVRLSDDALDPPSMFVEDNQMIGFEYDGVSKVFYSIDYVDSSLEDIEETELNVQEPYVTLEGPCTVTAYAQNGDFKSATITGKLFGFAKSEISVINGETVEVPTIVPVIAKADGIEVNYSSGNESCASVSEGIITGNEYGSTTITGNMQLGNDPLSYDVLNSDGYIGEFTVNVIPPVPTFSLDEGEYRGDQTLEITTTVSAGYNPDIKYILNGNEEAEAANTYREALVLSETTTITAWVVAHDASGAPFNSERVTATYTITQPEQYGISVNGTAINEDNRINVLGDNGNTVQFDGRNTLILNGATINGGIVVNNAEFVQTPLTIYLKGINTIYGDNNSYLVENVMATAGIKVNFATGELTPGTLTYTYPETLKEPISAFVGCNVTYENGLTSAISEGPNSGSVLTITTTLSPIVDETDQKETVDGDGNGLGKDIEDKGDSQSPSPVSVIVNKILYTLSENDGYLLDGSYKVVALNTSSSVPNALPGTDDFADNFKGLTILLPAGAGEIVVNALTEGDGVLNIQIGNLAPVQFSGLVTFTDCAVPYALTEPTYVYVYKTEPATSRSIASRRAPGRKETTTIEIKGLSVRASMVAASPAPSMSPENLSRTIIDGSRDGSHVVINNPDINGLVEGAFHGLYNQTITYVDLSGTSIKGVEVGRTSALFSDIPANAFIYLPVGNTVKAGTKNVIIGAVCNNMELAEGSPFEISQDFIAVEATQARDYSSLLDKNCTVYLPFAIDAETVGSLGKFYELSAVADGKVTMETVTATQANTPYMFKPSASTISVKMAEVKKPADSPTFPTKGSATFMGTYTQTSIVSGTDTYYCFKADDGKFVRVTGTSMTVNPFRAYIKVTGASLGRSLDIDTGDGATAIKNVKVGADDNIYYDMQGRRVLYPKNGLYIMNGKKVIIK